MKNRKHRFLVPLLIVASVSVRAYALTPYPTDESEWPGQGVIRVFDWFKDNRAHFWSQREKKMGAVVLAGDSLIGNWPRVEVEVFPDLIVANRGIGGDVSRGLLFRFQEDVVDLEPKAVVILIGTNDLSAHGKPADTAANISQMLELLKEKDPNTPVILCTIPPRNEPKAPTQPGKHEELNQQIRDLAEANENVELLDLFEIFANADGAPDPQYFKADQLHFGPDGYAKLQEELQKAFEKLKVE